MRWGWGSAWALGSVVALACACEDDEPGRLDCYEFIPGEVLNPSIGGTSADRVIAQAAGDLAVASTTAAHGLLSACSTIALDLRVERARIDEAMASLDLALRVEKMCALAGEALERDGAIPMTATPSCTSSSSFMAACLKQCVPASDDCSQACKASASVGAECPLPVDPHFSRILALRAHVALMLEDSSNLAGAENRNAAIKASCIPVAAYSAKSAISTITILRDEADKVLAAGKRTKP